MNHHPLSAQQEPLWLAHLLAPDSAAYVVCEGYECVGDIDPVLLRQALTDVVRRHAVLRTTFHSDRGRSYARIGPPPDAFDLDVVDLDADEPDDGEAVRRLCAAFAGRTFRLDTDRPMRGLLLRRPGRPVLILAWHHIVIDDWSARLVAAETAATYTAHAAGRQPELPAAQPQYHEYAAWQRRELRGRLAEAGAPDFWRTYLAGANGDRLLPTDFPRPPIVTDDGASVSLAVLPSVAARLRATARARRTTANVVALTAFMLVLRDLTGHGDLVVGQPCAARGRPDLDRTVGLFVNMMPFRVDLGAVEERRSAVDRVRRSVLTALEFHLTPLIWLVADLRVRRDLATTPLFQVVFQLHDDRPGSTAPLRWGQVEVHDWGGAAWTGGGDAHVRYELELTLRATADGGFDGTLRYRRDLFAAATIDRLATDFIDRIDWLCPEDDRQ